MKTLLLLFPLIFVMSCSGKTEKNRFDKSDLVSSKIEKVTPAQEVHQATELSEVNKEETPSKSWW